MKLSLDALKEKAKTVVSEELMSSISGGDGGCHCVIMNTIRENGHIQRVVIKCDCQQQ